MFPFGEAPMVRGGLTVQDVVLQILPVLDPQLLEQLRYWTDEKLLVPLRGTGKGTGNYRRYEEEMVWRAALLAHLAWRGANIEEMRRVIEMLDKMNPSERKLWELAKKSPECEVYLAVPPAGIGDAELFKGIEPLRAFFKTEGVALVANLGPTFAQTRRLRERHAS
jgi:DNA-binding transcriptional MerR regulator